MARKIKEGERAARIDEILDAAQALIQTKGYEQMTIQDLLDALGISKGAFYYYFDSKQALLEALVERMVEQVMAVLRPLVDDERLPALAKLEAVFRTAAGWKDERRDLLAELTRVWYADENVLVRDKLERVGLERIRSLLSPIIVQGIAEGTMSTEYPDLAGAIAMDLLRGMSEELVRGMMAWGQGHDGRERIARCIAAYTGAIEGLLGMEPGALRLVDPAMFDAWGEAFAGR
jgi:AcrR family transcriptional regulator